MKTSNSQNLRRVLVLLSMAVLLCWGAVAFADEDFVPSPDATACLHEEGYYQKWYKGMHRYICASCEIVLFEEEHFVTCNSDNCCILCEAEVDEGTCPVWHYDVVYKHDDTHHWKECGDCGNVFSECEVHTLECVTGKCTKCDAVDVTGDMEHYYDYQHDEYMHWIACLDCGDTLGWEYTREYHRIHCESGNCVICGEFDVTGVIEHSGMQAYDKTHHWMECGVCGERYDEYNHLIWCDDNLSMVCLACGATDVDGEIIHLVKYESISETQHRETCACGEVDWVMNHSVSCDSVDLSTCLWCHKENVVCVVSHYNITGEYEFNEKEHWFTCNICQDMIVEAHFRLADGTCIACDVIGLPAATPTVAPTVDPTAAPTAEPTTAPTVEPTLVPPMEPTATPTAEPTAEPTTEPTVVPTAAPTATPTAEPTTEATAVPTITPTVEPTATPTAVPTAVPTTAPTAEPTATPTAAPTAKPTTAPKPVATVAPSANNSNEVKIKPIKMLEQELKEETASYASAVTIKVPIETLKETVDEETYEQIVQMPVHEQIVVILSVLSDGNGQTNLLEDAGIAISEESKAVVQNVVDSVSVLDEESTAAFQQLLEENFPKQEVKMDDKEYVYYLIPMYVTINDVTQVKYYAFCFDKEAGQWLFTIIDEGEDAMAALEQAKEDAE